jgi:hypothetical protein
MRNLLPIFLGGCLAIHAWSASPTIAADQASADAEAHARVTGLYQAWKSERDPAKRKQQADDLMDAIVKCYQDQPLNLADEVARDGLPRNEIAAPADSTKVTLRPSMTLPDVHFIDYPKSPVFRRISATRFEAWTSKEGWLFDNAGKVLAHVAVPRHDGTGREWFGAFLPNGRWITTDLWDEDRQVNAFDAHGHWLWELKGERILATDPLPADDLGSHAKPLIDWARADRTGKRWLVCVGEEMRQVSALVDQKGNVSKLPKGASDWTEVYPRSMGVRGGYVAFAAGSDDGLATLGSVTVAHGPFCNWPIFESQGWGIRMHDATLSFGFWPHSHAVYIEQQDSDESSPNLVWFFDAKGRYQGEVPGDPLGDDANGRDLLLTDGVGRVLKVSRAPAGLSVPAARQFVWPDGSPAVPLALYGDLHLGFFYRGPETSSVAKTARSEDKTDDIVLANF